MCCRPGFNWGGNDDDSRGVCVLCVSSSIDACILKTPSSPDLVTLSCALLKKKVRRSFMLVKCFSRRKFRGGEKSTWGSSRLSPLQSISRRVKVKHLLGRREIRMGGPCKKVIDPHSWKITTSISDGTVPTMIEQRRVVYYELGRELSFTNRYFLIDFFWILHGRVCISLAIWVVELSNWF